MTYNVSSGTLNPTIQYQYLCLARNCKFDRIWKFWDITHQIHSQMSGIFNMRCWTYGVLFYNKFHLDQCNLSPAELESLNLIDFRIFGRSIPTLLHQSCRNLAHDSEHVVCSSMPNLTVISISCYFVGWEMANLRTFWILGAPYPFHSLIWPNLACDF